MGEAVELEVAVPLFEGLVEVSFVRVDVASPDVLSAVAEAAFAVGVLPDELEPPPV